MEAVTASRSAEPGAAIVTGGARGIGAATVGLLSQRGHAVCVNFRADEAAAASVVARLEAAGAKAVAIRADVADERDVVAMFERVDRLLGRISVLVNNAAIVRPQTRVEQMDAGRINEILATNVTGAFLCSREAVKRMSTRRGGRGGCIVNVSSAAARTGSPGEYVDYAASKGAVDALTRGLALEVAGEGIRVNGVRPGFIRTRMHADSGEPRRVDRLEEAIPMKRGGTADEVARAICWLASAEASYCTGTFIDCAGGR
jgi:NAD(P)-dependent dehydrogenase (short-subunit alcohol dehydrogenase family)